MHVNMHYLRNGVRMIGSNKPSLLNSSRMKSWNNCFPSATISEFLTWWPWLSNLLSVQTQQLSVAVFSIFPVSKRRLWLEVLLLNLLSFLVDLEFSLDMAKLIKCTKKCVKFKVLSSHKIRRSCQRQNFSLQSESMNACYSWIITVYIQVVGNSSCPLCIMSHYSRLTVNYSVIFFKLYTPDYWVISAREQLRSVFMLLRATWHHHGSKQTLFNQSATRKIYSPRRQTEMSRNHIIAPKMGPARNSGVFLRIWMSRRLDNTAVLLGNLSRIICISFALRFL